MSARTVVKSIQDIMRQDVGVDGDAQRLSQLCWMFFLKIIDDQDQQLEVLQDGYRSPIPPRLQWRQWAADPEGLTGDALMAFVNGELFPALKELQAKGSAAPRARVAVSWQNPAQPGRLRCMYGDSGWGRAWRAPASRCAGTASSGVRGSPPSSGRIEAGIAPTLFAIATDKDVNLGDVALTK